MNSVPEPTSVKPLGEATWWVYLEREHSPTLAVGPYPDAAIAEQAMQNAPLIDSFAEQDALDCWISQDQPEGTCEKAYVDLDDPDHTGTP